MINMVIYSNNKILAPTVMQPISLLKSTTMAGLGLPLYEAALTNDWTIPNDWTITTVNGVPVPKALRMDGQETIPSGWVLDGKNSIAIETELRNKAYHKLQFAS